MVGYELPLPLVIICGRSIGRLVELLKHTVFLLGNAT